MIKPNKLILFTLITLFAIQITACTGIPVPEEKKNYIGTWIGEGITLTIEKNGSVHYKKQKGSSKTQLDLPIKKFKGDSFIVGIGPLKTEFKVSKPPYKEGQVWKMVVDGNTLTKQ